MLGGGFEKGRVYSFFGLPGEGKTVTLENLMYQIWKYNKGFKYFIGIPFSKYDFMEVLRDKYKEAKKSKQNKKEKGKVFIMSYDEIHKFARENGYE